VSVRLALNGGTPVRRTLLGYGRQSVDDDDIRAVADVLRSEMLTTGPRVDAFEAALAETTGAAHVVCFSSGTAALHAAAFAAGLGPGDEAVTTPLTFCATSNCVLYQGGRPVFADIAADTLNLDPDAAARAVTSRTKAILPVDFGGQPADLDPFLDLAARHGLVIIEDASHALGARYKGRGVGTISHMTVFSFHPVKHVTTGEGGAVTTADTDFARRLRLFRNHGISTEARERAAKHQWFYEMVELGYNYRLSDLHCALGINQLRKFAGWLGRRRALARRYDEAFARCPAVTPLAVRPWAEHAYHLYVVRLNLERLSADREAVYAALRAEGIGVNVHYIPVHLHPYYQRVLGTRSGSYPIAERAYEQILTLPLFPSMTDADADDVVAAVLKVADAYAR
jgi:perosamine synthetase